MPCRRGRSHFQVDRREDGLVAVGFDAVRADRGAHDVEMRVVHRVVLLRGGGDDAERLRIDHLVAAVGGLADLAHADAAVHAGHAHAGCGTDRTFGPVLGEGRGRGIDSWKVTCIAISPLRASQSFSISQATQGAM